MVATNINIENFAISGGSGADGDGIAEKNIITLNNGHTGYLKKVHGSDDPSVNQLIIIPSKNGVIQNISLDTDEDYHSIDNLSGVNRIYYLVFATQEDSPSWNVSSELAQIIGNSFLATINSQNINQILSNLNTSSSNITNNITDLFVFTDWNNGNPRTRNLGGRSGLREPNCMAYAGNNTFFITSDDGLFSITTGGFVSLISSQSLWADCRGLAFLGDRLYAVYANTNMLSEINPVTGDTILPSILINGTVGLIATTVYSIRALASDGVGLFVLIDDNNGLNAVGYISDLTPNVNNEIFAYAFGEFRATGGFAVERFGRTALTGNVFENETSTTTALFLDQANLINANELEVQWHQDDNADQSFENWNPIAVQQVIQESSYIKIIINKAIHNIYTTTW
jgi:hypothetical protein